MRRLNLMVMVLLTALFLNSSSAWSLDRFVDLGDGTVLDTTSHLRWLKNANCFGQQDWATAMSSASNLASPACGLNDGSGAGDWHLPTIAELRIFVDDGYRTDTLNAAGFVGVNNEYWSSSLNKDNAAGEVVMSNGFYGYTSKGFSLGIWPVRNGQYYLGTASVSPASNDFGSVRTTTTSVQTFTLSNSGTQNLSVSSMTLSGTDAALFSLNRGDGTGGSCGATPSIVPAGSCTVSVSFTPTSAGSKSAGLLISSNDLNTPNKTVALSGSGIVQVIQSYDPNVSWWRAEGNTNDSVGSNNGTLHGGITFAAGKLGQAFSFDGSVAQYVSVPHASSLDILGNHSIAFWVKLGELPATGKSYLLVSKWTNGLEHKQVAVGPDGKISYFLFGTTATSGVTSTAALQTGVWTHIATTYDGGYMKIYINGVQNASTPANNDVWDSTGTLYLGYNPEISSSQYFKGQLDEIGWYNRTLSQAEITVISNSAPDSFSFPPRFNSPLSDSIESGAITVSGISLPTGISVSGGEYAISTDNGGSWGNWTNAPGMVSLNSQVKLSLTSADGFNTSTTATLTLGSVSGAFTVTTQRFVDLGDGTMLDAGSKLRWLQNANCTTSAGGIDKTAGTLNWADAQTWSNHLASPACALKDGSATGDWHLPTIDELRIFTDAGYRDNTLDAAGFSNVHAYYYWSSSPDADYASGVYMVDGDVNVYYKNEHYYVWPVRAGEYWPVGSLVVLGNGGFGNLSVGAVSSSHQFILKNAAAADQHVSGIALIGADATQFSLAPGGSSPCASLTPALAAGASCTVLVSANPTSGGSKSASLTVTTAAGSAAIPLTVTAIYPAPIVTSISPPSGFSVGGTPVTINGANLTGATAVKFATTNATDFTVSSDTQVTVTSPAGVVGQTVDITVTTPGGTSATSSGDQFTYTLQYQAQNHSTNPYTPYSTLAVAISAALAGAEIRACAGQFDGVFSLARDIQLYGGYDDAFNIKGSLPTTLNNSLTVDGGVAKLDTVTVKDVLTIKGGSLQASGVVVH